MGLYLIARAVQQLLKQHLWQLDAHRYPICRALAQQPSSPAVHKQDNRITSMSMECMGNHVYLKAWTLQQLLEQQLWQKDTERDPVSKALPQQPSGLAWPSNVSSSPQ